MKKVKGIFKKNVKLVIGIIIGGVVFGTLGVYAATVLAASQVSYTKNSQSTVDGALDTLFTRANTWINPNNNFGTPKYYAFGTYKGWCSSTDKNCNSYANFPTTATTPPSGKNVYAAKYADGGYGVCIKRNGTQHCFRGRNWIAEAQHIQKVFSDVSCDVNSSGVGCRASDFSCYVYSDGRVICNDNGASARCNVSAGGCVECRG